MNGKLWVRKTFVILIFSYLLATTSVLSNAGYTDLTTNMKYFNEATRISTLNIITGDDKGLFRPTSKITREQFTTAIFKALGQGNVTVDAKYAASPFSDVATDRWSYGYISTALKNGWISLNAQNTFRPDDEIKFAEAVTIAVKAISTEKPEGAWPDNCINFAYSLSLLTDLKMDSFDKITRLEAAVILDRLWYLNQVTNKNFNFSKVDSTVAGTEIIVTADKKVNKKLKDYQVQTNIGVYKKNLDGMKLETGGKYKVFIYEDTIMAILDKSVSTEYASIKNAVGSNIRINDFDGKFKDYILSEKLDYYYNGSKILYATIASKLNTCSSVVFGYNVNKTDFDYAVIIDPVYSDPHSTTKEDLQNGVSGALNESNADAKIIRDGTIISFKDLEERDVVYSVTDIQGKNEYFLVMNNRVEGKITDIKPNLLSPATLSIDGRDYDLSDQFPLERLNANFGGFGKESYVQLLIGYDSRVIDIYDDASDFSMVINATTQLSAPKAGNVRETEFYATLMTSNGTATEFKTDQDYKISKGSLVKINRIKGADTVKLDRINYSGSLNLSVNKDDKIINDRYAADNMRIFNLITNDIDTDATISLVRWSDLPSGSISWEKVLHVGISGDFGDVNVLVLKDLFDAPIKYGYIKDDPSYSKVGQSTDYYATKYYVDGVLFSANSTDKTQKDEVYAVSVNGTSLSKVKRMDNKMETKKIEAIDSKRIKFDGKIYPLSTRLKIQNLDKFNTVTATARGSLNITKTYANIVIYFDNEFGKDKIVFILTKE